jgi:Mg-chelatase subunit ChlD
MKRPWTIVFVVLFGLLALQDSWAESMVKRVRVTDLTVSPILHAYVSVLDQDRAFLGGLDPGAFDVSEDNIPVSPNVAEERVGMAVMVLVDLSGSMKEVGVADGQTRMDSLKEVAIQFIEQYLAPEDWVGVIGFHVETVAQQELTQDHGAARNRVYELNYDPDKNTALLNTAGQALDALDEAPMGRMRKAMLVFSDGKDYLEKEDPVRYREFREAVARKGRDYGIPIFVVGVGSYCGNNETCVRNYPENEYNFEDVDWLADQTDGISYHYTTLDEQAGLFTFFDRLASQSLQYHLSYDTHLPKGDHSLHVRVNAGGAWAEDEKLFASPFEFPLLELKGPVAGTKIPTDSGPVTWELSPTFTDGWERPLADVKFYVDDQAVYTDTTSPYTCTWDVKGYTHVQESVIWAEAEDSILRQTEQTSPIKVTLRPPLRQLIINWIVDHSVALGVGLLSIVLFIILFRKRQTVIQAVGQAASQVKAATTQLLGGQQRVFARLKVVQGAHVGRMYKIMAQSIYVGRENCDVVVEEGLTIHRQHAFIGLHGTQWYVYDLGKTNGIWVDNVRLPANGSAYLRSGSRIRMGDVDFEFLIVGGTTQILSQP